MSLEAEFKDVRWKALGAQLLNGSCDEIKEYVSKLAELSREMSQKAYEENNQKKAEKYEKYTQHFMEMAEKYN